MNSAVIRSLSAVLAPNNVDWPKPSSSMACNRWGDLFVLESRGRGGSSSLSFRSMKSAMGDDCLRELPIHGKDVSLLSQAQCLEFNLHGNILLVWGAHNVLLVTLPPSFASMGGGSSQISSLDEANSLPSAEVRCVFDSSNAAAAEGPGGSDPQSTPFEILRAQWHPFNEECIVLLTRGNFGSRLVVLNVFSGKATPIFLSAHADYKSFTFGPRSGCGGWMAVSVLVLSADGRVTVVCPVLPPGSILPAPLAIEILQAVADEKKKSSFTPSGGSESAEDIYQRHEKNSLITLSKLFVSAAFGDLSDAYLTSDRANVVVGGPLSYSAEKESDAQHLDFGSSGTSIGLNTVSSRASVLRSMLEWPPSSQGAMLNPDDLSKYSRGLTPSPAKRSSGDSSASMPPACDICVLPSLDHGRRNPDASAPIIAIARSDGSIELFVCVGDVRPRWNAEGLMSAHPNWSLADKDAFCASIFGDEDTYNRLDLLDDSILLSRLPELVCVETIGSPEVPSGLGRWSLRPDPVVPHILHLIGADTGTCSVVVVHWLADAITRVEEISSHSGPDGGGGASSPIYKLSQLAKSPHKDSSSGTANADRTPSEVMPYFPTSSWHASNDGKHTISALLIISDAYLGHIAIVRTFCEGLSGKAAFSTVTSVNLSVFVSSKSQEKRLTHQMQSTVYHEPTDSGLMLALNSDDAFHKMASSVLSDAKRALQEVKLRLAQCSREKSSGAEFQKKELSEIWKLLEEKVVNKLEEFQLRLRFTTEAVQDAYKAQVEVLLGGGNGTGLKEKIARLRSKKVDLENRLAGISSNLEIEMQLCAGMLAFGGAKSRGLTAAEKEYRSQLLEWSNAASRLAPLVEEVERLQLKQIQDLSSSATMNMASPPPSGAQRRGLGSQGDELAKMEHLRLQDSAFSPERSSTLPAGSSNATKPASFLTPLSHVNPQTSKPPDSGLDGTVVSRPEVRWTVHTFNSPTAKKVPLPRRIGLNRAISSDRNKSSTTMIASPGVGPSRRPALSTPVVHGTPAEGPVVDQELLQRLGAKGAELEHLAKELSRLDKKLLYISCDPGSGAKAAN